MAMSSSLPSVKPSVKRFFIVAGEASGDMHAARLMKAMKSLYATRDIKCVFEGIGGEQMLAEGLESLVALEQVNVAGFWEVAKRYPFFRRLLVQCQKKLASGIFDAFIPVDYPGFNLRLATQARRTTPTLPICWYIAPQLWAWGASRAQQLQQSVDILLVVFPFEEEFFRRYGIRTEYVGHPLLDRAAVESNPFINAICDLDKRLPVIALLPGSRTQEIRRNLPLMLQAVQILASKPVFQGYEAHVAVAPYVNPDLYSAIAHRYSRQVHSATKQGVLPIRFVHNSRTLMQQARVGVIKTGTSTLEAALLGLPFVMAYRTSSLTYHIAKRKITLPLIALANIVAGKQVVQEFIQHDATPQAIASEVEHIVLDKAYCQAMVEEFSLIRHMLHCENTESAEHRENAASASLCAARHIAALLE